jgi:hypothetical protein
VVDEGYVENSAIVATREFIAGVAVIVVAAFALPVLFPNPSPAGRALVMSVVTGVLMALFTDWRARLGVATASIMAFAGFAGPGSGALTSDPGLWSYTPLIGLAATLGCGYRLIADVATGAVTDDSRGRPEPLDQSQ